VDAVAFATQGPVEHIGEAPRLAVELAIADSWRIPRVVASKDDGRLVARVAKCRSILKIVATSACPSRPI